MLSDIVWILTQWNVAGNKWQNLEAPILAHMHVGKVTLPIFIHIVNVLNLYFQSKKSKKFESSTLGLYVIISQNGNR